MFFLAVWVGHMGAFFCSIPFIFCATHATFFADSGDIKEFRT